MTEFSLPWPDSTDPGPQIGDGRPFTAEEWSQVWEALFVQMDSDTKGVVPDAWNDLEVTSPGANQIRVDTGFALVKGKLYWNDDLVDLTASSAAAGTERYDSVILQCDWTGDGDTERYTVRLAIKEGDSESPPSMTQTDETLWELELYTYKISDSGTISELTDQRVYIAGASLEDSVSTDMIQDDAVTPDKMSSFAYQLYIPLVHVEYDGLAREANSWEQFGNFIYIDPDKYKGDTVTWTFYANAHVDAGDSGTAEVRLTYPGGARTLSTDSTDEDTILSGEFSPTEAGEVFVDIRNATSGNNIRAKACWITVDLT